MHGIVLQCTILMVMVVVFNPRTPRLFQLPRSTGEGVKRTPTPPLPFLDKIRLTTHFNCLMYADNTVLISMSATGLQRFICEKYAKDCDIIFNVKESKYMCINPQNVPSLMFLLALN